MDYTKAKKAYSPEGDEWHFKGDYAFYYNSVNKKTCATCASILRRNNRGITLANYTLAGEKLVFTLKPSAWTFE